MRPCDAGSLHRPLTLTSERPHESQTHRDGGIRDCEPTGRMLPCPTTGTSAPTDMIDNACVAHRRPCERCAADRPQTHDAASLLVLVLATLHARDGLVVRPFAQVLVRAGRTRTRTRQRQMRCCGAGTVGAAGCEGMVWRTDTRTPARRGRTPTPSSARMSTPSPPIRGSVPLPGAAQRHNNTAGGRVSTEHEGREWRMWKPQRLRRGRRHARALVQASCARAGRRTTSPNRKPLCSAARRSSSAVRSGVRPDVSGAATDVAARCARAGAKERRSSSEGRGFAAARRRALMLNFAVGPALLCRRRGRGHNRTWRM